MDEQDDGFCRLKDARFTIIGLGLMGGSFALALKERGIGRRVWGVNRRSTVIDRAQELGAIDGGTPDAIEGVADADIVVLATPVRAIIELLEKIGPHLKAGCLVIDLGSTKSDIVQAMASLPAGVEPVGGHPMCGKEVSGIWAAEASLYEGAIFPLTPLERTSPTALRLAERLVESIGATPVIIDAGRHDRLVAAVSHLPYLTAVMLVAAAAEIADEDVLAWPLAASGFRDTSRLAASDVTMMHDILITNREHVAEMLHRYRRHLNRLIDLVENGHQDELRTTLEQAWQDR
ncbi:MAG: prephenate dehydrogenase, partial [Anaerolineae bacterium]